MEYITVGMAGAGRAAELHMLGYGQSPVPIRLKTVVSRRPERASFAQERYGFEKASLSFEDLLTDREIDVIDICTPPYVHAEMIIKALDAGKHVICEKPLTGYFGRAGDTEPIGDKVPKPVMYVRLLEDLEKLKTAVESSGLKFMYAENFVYSPGIIKAGQIVRAKKSRILYMKGEESLKGSSSPVAGEWAKTGGGIFIRNGTHPLGAVLWLKMQEARARGVDIRPESVVADMGYAVRTLDAYDRRHISARPVDVEDSGTAVVTFTDGTKALIISTDNLLGGSSNYVELYCSDAAIKCRLTMNDAMETYMLDEDGMEDVYLSEMLPVKTGWNKPFVADEVLRGYTNEIRDFMNAVFYNREPESGFQLAHDVVKIVYAAYLSSETGRRIRLQ